jgi:hypothetical protein
MTNTQELRFRGEGRRAASDGGELAAPPMTTKAVVPTGRSARWFRRERARCAPKAAFPTAAGEIAAKTLMSDKSPFRRRGVQSRHRR